MKRIIKGFMFASLIAGIAACGPKQAPSPQGEIIFPSKSLSAAQLKNIDRVELAVTPKTDSREDRLLADVVAAELLSALSKTPFFELVDSRQELTQSEPAWLSQIADDYRHASTADWRPQIKRPINLEQVSSKYANTDQAPHARLSGTVGLEMLQITEGKETQSYDLTAQSFRWTTKVVDEDTGSEAVVLAEEQPDPVYSTATRDVPFRKMEGKISGSFQFVRLKDNRPLFESDYDEFYANKVGGGESPGQLSPRLYTLASLAKTLAKKLASEIAPYRQKYPLTLDQDDDIRIRNLITAGAYQAALAEITLQRKVIEAEIKQPTELEAEAETARVNDLKAQLGPGYYHEGLLYQLDGRFGQAEEAFQKASDASLLVAEVPKPLYQQAIATVRQFASATQQVQQQREAGDKQDSGYTPSN